MLKRFIGFTLCLTLLFSMSIPVFAVQNETEPAERKSIEDILNQYHERAFQQEFSDETCSVSAQSRSGGAPSKTLEEETVEELIAEGYEAYNVTSENYETLQASLHTDFAELGLDPNGSYVVVISGEESDTPVSSGARVLDPPHYDYGDEGVGSSSFSYTYNGTTYSMRYVTITGADNPNYHRSNSSKIYNNEGLVFLNNLLSTIISMVIDNGSQYNVGTVLSIMGTDIVNIIPPENSQLTYHGGANWTHKYVEVYDSSSGSWAPYVDTEYVTCDHRVYAYYYSSTLNSYTGSESEIFTYRIYTPHYSNSSWLKEKAALMYIAHSGYTEYTGPISFYRGNSYMFTLNEFYG